MEVIKHNSVPEDDATDAPLFYGGPVSRQPLVGGDKSEYFSFSLVNFYDGAKNKFHSHTSDQILFATKGEGIVASESEELAMTEGGTWRSSPPARSTGTARRTARISPTCP